MSIATIKRDLLSSLKDREFRSSFNLENVYTTVCFQLRALREQRGMSQSAFGRSMKPTMAQERVSILEDPNAETKPTLSTLLRLADGLDVGLEVRFVPFSKVLDRSTDTDMQELEVDSFDTELPLIEQAVAYELAVEDQLRAARNEFAWGRELLMGSPNSNDAKSPLLPERKQPMPERGIYLVKGGLANGASVGASG